MKKVSGPQKYRVIYKLYAILDLRKQQQQKIMLRNTQTPDCSQSVDIYRFGNGFKVSFLGQYHISITLGFPLISVLLRPSWEMFGTQIRI